MLKWIALILMLVDHFAYTLQSTLPYEVYIVMRSLGRLSFPVFVYYVVLGLGRTSNLKVYMTRLFMFGLLSEAILRYYWMFRNPHLNIIFSLFLYGLIYMLFENRLGSFKVSKTMRIAMVALLTFLLPYVEYGYGGFFVFLSLYYVHKKIPEGQKHIYAAVLITLSFVPGIIFSGSPAYQWFAGLIGLLMFNKYWDKRMFAPKVEKWTFYWAYPLQWILFAVLFYKYT